jgi:uncharacterized membrane protein
LKGRILIVAKGVNTIINKIKQAVGRIPSWVYYWVIGILFVPAYIYGHSVLLDPKTYYVAILSTVTVNFVLFLFWYGVVMDKVTKKMNKWVGWLLWGIGFIGLIMVFKYIGGMETII